MPPKDGRQLDGHPPSLDLRQPVMAWFDDRLWCHPKFTDLTDRAFRTYVNAVTYSSGFSLQGRLTPGQQTTIGATPKVRAELVKAGLWDLVPDGGGVYIHDWDEHNAKRDARKATERRRKKDARDTWTSTQQPLEDGMQDGAKDPF